MAGQPGSHLLVEDDLGVLVTGRAQRHDEEPRGERFARVGIEQPGAGAEVHLGGFSRREIEQHRGLDAPLIGQRLDKSPNGGITAGKPTVADQGAVDGGAVDAFGDPGLHLVAKGFHQGWCGVLRPGSQGRRQFRLVRQSPAGIEPAAGCCQLPQFAGLAATDKTVAGEIAVGIA